MIVWCMVPHTTGGALFAEGPGHSAKAQKPSTKALPSAALGKEPSEKKLTVKRFFAEGYLSGTRQSLFRVPTVTLDKEKQPSTALLRWRRLCRVPTVRTLGKDIFFQKLFAECHGGAHSAKPFFNFLKKLFAECLPSLALGKDFLLFLKKNLCRVQCPGTRQSFPALPSAMTIALGKSTEIVIFLFFAFHWHKQFKYISHVTYISQTSQ